MSEQWRPCVGREGWYEVSNLGQVRRVRPGPGTRVGRILKQFQTPHGHRQVQLSNGSGDGGRLVFVHRLVAEAFIGPAPGDEYRVLHWSDVGSDNRVTNLRWGTQGDNLRDSVRNGTNYWASRTKCPMGHDLTDPANVKPRGGSEGGRRCIPCTRKRQREWYGTKKGRL